MKKSKISIRRIIIASVCLLFALSSFFSAIILNAAEYKLAAATDAALTIIWVMAAFNAGKEE